MGAKSAREFAHALDGRLAALADDLGRPERAGQRDAVGMTPQHDDPLGAEPARGNDGAQTNRAVADNRCDFAGTDLCGERGVVASTHHIRERQQGRHQRVVRADRKRDQGSVGKRDADRLALATIELCPAPPSTMQAGGL